jgi:quinoprotein glucose dehydrogenase
MLGQILSAAVALLLAGGPTAPPPVDWPATGGDPGGMKYSAAAAIDRSNVKSLEVAWTYRTGDNGEGFAAAEKRAFEATPIVADGVLYLSTPTNRIVALDAETGAHRWTYDPKIDPKRGYSEFASRGVATWVDSRRKPGEPGRRRIFVGTLDARLVAVDAATGQPASGFGRNGSVDLAAGVKIKEASNYQVTSPPAIAGDVVVVGSSIGDNRAADLERGVVRGYDARTGRQLWAWDPIPTSAADPAAESWKDGSASRTGAANAWSIISVDAARGLVFVPTSSASPDFYGGERKGANRWANSVAALRADTGALVWAFQVVHHDLWDYDVASQPLLVTLERGGRKVDAVVVVTKIGHLFVLDRETGKPIFPVEERPVPQTDVAGEATSPTQPFPVGVAPLAPQTLRPEDAWGPTPEDCDWCRKRIGELRSDGLFTPPSLRGSLLFPGNVGGAHWGGAAFDPVRQLLVVPTNRLATMVRLVPRDDLESTVESARTNRLTGEFGRQRGTPYAMYREILRSPSGAPCNAPPWGALVAVDLATGAKRWEAPVGFVEMGGKRVAGSPNLGGGILTAGGLFFIAATFDGHLRAFDVETGAELWSAKLRAGGQATPMTYRSASGRQFVVIAAGGHGKMGTPLGDSVVAFALPVGK